MPAFHRWAAGLPEVEAFVLAPEFMAKVAQAAACEAIKNYVTNFRPLLIES